MTKHKEKQISKFIIILIFLLLGTGFLLINQLTGTPQEAQNQTKNFVPTPTNFPTPTFIIPPEKFVGIRMNKKPDGRLYELVGTILQFDEKTLKAVVGDNDTKFKYETTLLSKDAIKPTDVQDIIPGKTRIIASCSETAKDKIPPCQKLKQAVIIE